MIAGRGQARPSGSAVATAFIATLACASWLVIGVAAAYGRGKYVGAALVVAAAICVGVWNWRYSLYGLLLFIPFSGLPFIVTYPNTQIAALLKDLLFVVPAYLGFLVALSARRVRLIPPGAPAAPLLAFAVLVLAQALNPGVPNHFAAAIGVKVWLLYVPMYALGFYFVRTRQDLWRVLGVMAVTGLLPAIIGIIEALLIYGGQSQTVYGFYGAAAEAATQHFAIIQYGRGLALQRVPSTFSYVAQYYCFVSTMVPVAFAWWRGRLSGRWLERFGLVAWVLLIVAGMLTGQLGAILFIPALALLILLLHGSLRRLSPRLVFTALLLAVGVLSLVGLAVGRALLVEAVSHGTEQLQGVFFSGFARRFGSSLLGHGTGIDTGAARYAFADQSSFTTANEESWYLKALLELGVLGLAVLVVLLGTLLKRAWRVHRALSNDPALKAVSAALVAFLIWNIVYATKASLIDLDPINIYFWLLAGILARLPYLASTEAIPALRRGGDGST